MRQLTKKLNIANSKYNNYIEEDQIVLSSIYRRARFRISWVKVIYKLALLIPSSFINALIFFPFWLLRIDVHQSLKKFFHKLYSQIAGISYRVHGAPLKQGNVFYVCNHVSYTDILILMALAAPRFFARIDVVHKFFFGWLMRSYGTIGILRARNKAQEQVEMFGKLLARNNPLLIFPEGTTSDGRGVLPMKSSLFAALASENAKNSMLQPITIRYSLLDGMPVGTCWQPFLAWYGDMPFIPHLLEILSMHRITADIYIHPAVKHAKISSSRKELAQFCENKIREGLEILRTRTIEPIANKHTQQTT